jgi:hypothetical protein
MKRILFITLIIICLGFTTKIKAQFDFIGGGVVLATGGEYKLNGYPYYNNSLGINVRASYNYNKKLKIVPNLNIYLPKTESFANGGSSKTTVIAFNLNGHYIVNHKTRESYRVYLLAGIHVSGWNIKDTRQTSIAPVETLDVNEYKIIPGVNLGGGMQLNISNRLKFFAEIKYVISTSKQLAFNPGLIYEF